MQLVNVFIKFIKALRNRNKIAECPHCSAGEYNKCPEAREIMEMAIDR